MDKRALKKSLGETEIALVFVGAMIMLISGIPGGTPIQSMAFLIGGFVILLFGIVSGLLSTRIKL